MIVQNQVSSRLKRCLLVVCMMLVFSGLLPELMPDVSASNLIITGDGIQIGASDVQADYDDVTDKLKVFLQWASGIIALFMFFILILQFSKLGAAGDNDQARRKAIQGILTAGIGLSLFGGASIVVGFFWNALNND